MEGFLLGGRVNIVKILVSGIIAFFVLAACQPLPERGANSPAAPTSPSSSVTASSASSSVTSSVSSSASSAKSPPVSVATQNATPTPVVIEEEDCMAGCHIPDPNEFYAAGANPQPASHVKQTTCLNCHNTLATPALPASHSGRMDPSCATCHVESTK